MGQARKIAATHVIVDTAGRLHIDEELMAELEQVKKVLKPHEVLLVVDAMTGQEAVRVAEEFHAKVDVTGLVMTKMDGDARGGAALSIRWVSGVPVKFIGMGEKVDALEPFYPDRLASRILGMGDMADFIEKAEKTLDAKRGDGTPEKGQERHVRPGGLPRPVEADPQDGPHRPARGDDTRHGPACQQTSGRRPGRQ
jgi:signal recognition particle subunit SRP54